MYLSRFHFDTYLIHTKTKTETQSHRCTSARLTDQSIIIWFWSELTYFCIASTIAFPYYCIFFQPQPLAHLFDCHSMLTTTSDHDEQQQLSEMEEGVQAHDRQFVLAW